MARAGDVIGGKYRLIHPLGIGGMGAVWRAEHQALKQQVAIKLLDARGPQADRAVKRFQREAQIAASIRHRNIVYISDFGTDRGTPYLVMELLTGVPLSERMVVGEPLGVGSFLRLMEEVLQGLAAVHAAGVVHRDMKPENIFLVREADDSVFPKLLDFGVSRSTERTAGHTITREGIVMGTPEYVSPEQARGNMADFRSDLYSVGVVMYEALAGRLPFQADNAADLIVAVLNAVPIPLVSLRPDLGERMSQLVAKAMARRPDDRFQSAEEMREAILELLESEPSLEDLSLPRRFLAPGTRPTESAEDFGADDEDDARGASATASLRPTEALPTMFGSLRKRWMTLGVGGLSVVLALSALVFVTAGGKSSPAVHAASEPRVRPEPEPTAPAAEPQPAKPAQEVLVELHGVPVGARVLVDGVLTSDNPLKLERGSGQREISVEVKGMQPWRVLHDSENNGHYAVSLEPLTRKERRLRAPKDKPSEPKGKNGLLRRPDF